MTAKNRQGNARLPELQLKPDTTRNGSVRLTYAVARQRTTELKLCPLRIDSRTVIYVTPDKCNEQFRSHWLAQQGKPERQMNIEPTIKN